MFKNLMRILSGVLQPDSGEILLGGERTAFRSAHDAQERGIGDPRGVETLLSRHGFREIDRIGRLRIIDRKVAAFQFCDKQLTLGEQFFFDFV